MQLICKNKTAGKGMLRKMVPPTRKKTMARFTCSGTLIPMKYLYVLCACLWTGLAARAQPGAFPAGWKLGTSTGLIGEMTPETLREVRQSGIEYLEISWKKTLVEGSSEERQAFVQQIRREAAVAGLSIWSTHIPYGKRFDLSEPDSLRRRAVIETVKEYIDLALMLGVRQMVIHPSIEPIEAQDRRQRFQACRESLKELSLYCKGKPASLALECLPRTCLGNTSGEILSLLQGIEGIGICFDTNHLLQEKPEDFVKAVGNRIRTIHVSDFDGINERHWMPGRGIIDWKAVISALRAAGYKGSFMYEVVKREGDSFTFKDLKANYEWLRQQAQ